MAKRRKIKKSVFLVGGIILFFGVYIGSFMLFSKVENSDKKNAVTINTEREDNRSLLKQLEDKEKIYLSDGVVNKEEYYKIPVSSKDEFKKILEKSIYTSFDFVKQYKTWKEVKITYKDKTKNLSRWKYDDLANTMASKRIVGKVQPEKSKERSDYNFVIQIKADNYEAKIETMGEDYVKISSKDLSSYYEVHTALYTYIKDEVFKLSK